jgi:hypothetical protein
VLVKMITIVLGLVAIGALAYRFRFRLLPAAPYVEDEFMAEGGPVPRLFTLGDLEEAKERFTQAPTSHPILLW